MILRQQISCADLSIVAESTGLFTQPNGSHPRHFSGLLDVGTMSPNCQSHQGLSHCELLLECCCQLLTGLKGKGTVGIMVVESQNNCPRYLMLCVTSVRKKYVKASQNRPEVC
uniref:Putative fragile x mental retardation syndrome-related protein 2 n=1 Tax=Ixodes ricinus TaxID=34613 RepID=A0A0K8R526_IXORI